MSEAKATEHGLPLCELGYGNAGDAQERTDEISNTTEAGVVEFGGVIQLGTLLMSS
jgi:hypothetical protein